MCRSFRQACSPARLCAYVTIAWVLFLIVFPVLKIVGFDDGLRSFFIHFTNWAWVFGAIFFVATLGYCLKKDCCCNTKCSGYVVAVCFWALNGIVWFVMLAVFFLLLYNSTFIEKVIAEMKVGMVIVGNDVYHVIPVLALVFWSFAHWYLIVYGTYLGYAKMQAWCCTRGCGRVTYCLYASFGGQLVLFGIYLFVLWCFGTSVYEVYHVSVSCWYAVLGFVVVGLLVNGVPILLLGEYEQVTKRTQTHSLLESLAAMNTRIDIFEEHEGEEGERLVKLVENAARASMGELLVDLKHDVDEAAVVTERYSLRKRRKDYLWRV